MNNRDPIIPVEALQRAQPTQKSDALAKVQEYYELFAQPDLLKSLGIDIDAEGAFYNRYYWFLTFVKKSSVINGFDAGLEQQAFELLERADINIDWTIIEDITRRVNEENAANRESI